VSDAYKVKKEMQYYWKLPFNPFTPRTFAEKRRLKVFELFYTHRLAKKKQNLPKMFFQV